MSEVTQEQTTTETTEVSTAPAEVTAKDLGKYDIVLIVDKSGSMSEKDGGSQTRWQQAQESTEALARKAAEFDEDGIAVIVFSNNAKVYDGVTPDKVGQVFIENEPNGGTYTHLALEEALKLRKGKPMIVAVITDGEATEPEALEKVIVDASNALDQDSDLGITFLQVGKNQDARNYLKHLDDGLVGKAKFDIVDTKTFDEMADLTLTEVLLGALND
jgi:Mg-chelatase subunit ChlD